MNRPKYPSLFQVNTRVYLSQLAVGSDVARHWTTCADTQLDEWAASGFDLIWLLGVWQTGPEGRHISAQNAEWLAEYARILPDF